MMPWHGDDPITKDVPRDNPQPGSTHSMDTPALELCVPTLLHRGPPAQDMSPTQPGSIRFIRFDKSTTSQHCDTPAPSTTAAKIHQREIRMKISEVAKPLWQYPSPVSPHHATLGRVASPGWKNIGFPSFHLLDIHCGGEKPF